MLAGALDRRVRIWRRTGALNAYGEEIYEWLVVGAVWASRRDVSDRERMAADEHGGALDCRFQMRWSTLSAGIGADDRLECEGRMYQVAGRKEIGRRVGIEISAVARTDAKP